MLSYVPNQIPLNITVIGCGGTGSRLVQMLTQFIRSISREFSPTGWLERPIIRLVDDDVVEMKNTSRQLFIEQDVGKPKAVVLAQRYGRAYGVTVNPIVKRVEPNIYLSNLYHGDETVDDMAMNGLNTIFIMCVDSAEARRSILSCIARSSYGAGLNNVPFIIDAGNEDSFGQVKFFHSMAVYSTSEIASNPLSMYPKQGSLPAIPMPYEFYRDLVDTPARGSCADLDQTLAINAAMATTIMGIVQNFYYVRPFTFNEVGISLDGAGYTLHNTHNILADRIVARTESNNPLTSVYISYKDSGMLKYIQDNRSELDRINAEVRKAEYLRLEEEERIRAKVASPVVEAEEAESLPSDGSEPKKAKKVVDLPTPETIPASELPPLTLMSTPVRAG